MSECITYLNLPKDLQPINELVVRNISTIGYDIAVSVHFTDSERIELVFPEKTFEMSIRDSIQHSCSSFQVIYCDGKVSNSHVKTKGSTGSYAFVGLSDNKGKHYDVWCNDGLKQAISYDSFNTQGADFFHEHLSWTLTLLLCRYAIEDVFFLANTLCSRHVSRETWLTEIGQPHVDILSKGEMTAIMGHDFVRLGMSERQLRIGLYLVVDTPELIEALLKRGVKTVQLRIKEPSIRLEKAIEKSVKLGNKYNAHVFINDHWELAIKHSAFGVHLGQEDVETANLKAIAEAGIALGLSTHSYYEVKRALQIRPSYIALGHVFPTTTKEMKSLPQGLVNLKSYNTLVSNLDGSIPTVAIGGIDTSNAGAVIQTGVDGYALVRAITQCADLDQRLYDFRSIEHAARNKGCDYVG
jgi:thiamine-phosphate pyrophosphorylase